MDSLKNVITIEFRQEIPGYDGVQDPRIIIGVADYFKTYLNKNIFINSFFQYGIILTSIFVFGIIALLLFTGWKTADRYRYISSMMLVLSAIFYNVCFSGAFLKYYISFSSLMKLILTTSIFVAITITDFIHYFFLRRINLIATINRIICYGVMISFFFINSFVTISQIFNVLFVYAFIIILYLLVLAFISTWKAPVKRYGIIISTSIVIISYSVISDLLTDLSQNHMPFLTNITISIFIVLSSMVIIADFINISETNKKLTGELRQLNATLEAKVEERTGELNLLAAVDALSGLYNRREITTRLEKELTVNPYQHLSLIFFDIDNFKKINDIFGHQAGDKVIALIGGLIKTVLTTSDIPGRYGGDEFLLILPGADIRQANEVATKLKTMIAGSTIDFENHGIPVTASFGISSILDNEDHLKEQLHINSLKELYETPDLSKTGAGAPAIHGTKLKSQIIDLLIKMADDSLYRAKSNYCNQCGFRFTDIKQFESGKCPHCGSNELSLGKNKIVAFENETNQ
jgi:diguanylate cyclase (GGDEF)-like protein